MNNSEKLKKSLPHHCKSDPCPVFLKEKILLTDPKSSKKTYHISLDLKDTDLIFHPGDSIGVLPQNDPALVERFLSHLSTPASCQIIDPRSQEEMTAKTYLLQRVNLSRVNSSLIRYFLEKAKSSELREKLSFLLLPENKTALNDFLNGKDLIDIVSTLQESPTDLKEISSFFTPLLPRFYSISSSLKAYPDELHLLVALLSYPHGNEIRYGVASHFLCHLATNKTPISIYVQPAAHFKLPEDSSQNIIMIGPGTGVAPYRSFLQERISLGATGKNWLFFGERNRKFDFLYEDYLTDLESRSLLKLDTAFSRDQETKQYVQHKLLENAKELWKWICEGSYIYVCGDASKMAKDVEASFIKIFETQGGLCEHDAKAYLKQLRVCHRYMTDVY